jgi:hypothetical protein
MAQGKREYYPGVSKSMEATNKIEYTHQQTTQLNSAAFFFLTGSNGCSNLQRSATYR